MVIEIAYPASRNRWCAQKIACRDTMLPMNTSEILLKLWLGWGGAEGPDVCANFACGGSLFFLSRWPQFRVWTQTLTLAQTPFGAVLLVDPCGSAFARHHGSAAFSLHSRGVVLVVITDCSHFWHSTPTVWNSGQKAARCHSGDENAI